MNKGKQVKNLKFWVNIPFQWPQSRFAATKIYILFFNLTHSLFSLMGSFHFSQWKKSFSIHWEILKILGNAISQSFMLSLKCDHPLLCELPILFSTVKLKLGHTFSQPIHKYNISVLKCWFGAEYISKFFPIHKKEMENWDFWKALIAFANFPQFTEKFENWNSCPLVFIFGETVRVVFQYDDMWCQRSQCMIKGLSKNNFFVTRNRFCPLSKPFPPLPTLFLTDNSKMDRIPAKIKWKIHTFFTLYFKFWKYDL